MPEKNLIVYFVKQPEAGKVKTRLANTIGAEEAAKVYRELALKNFNRLKSLSEVSNIAVFFDPPESLNFISEWLRNADFYIAQEGQSLGDRLQNAFHFSFKKADRIIAVGSDTLALTKEIVHEAFRILENKDAVLGPADDGGYYLIGLTKLMPDLFENISWSTEHVLRETKDMMNQLNVSYGELSKLSDLDEWPKENQREALYELIRF